MKVKDLLPIFEPPNDGCEVCFLHDKAELLLPPGCLSCPHCGADLEIDEACNSIMFFGDPAVVGKDNGHPNPEDEIHRRALYECEECNNRSIIRLEPIIYNANHDIFYTGEGSYLPVRKDAKDLENEIKAIIKPMVEDYTKRIKSGDNLDSDNLVMWIAGEMERIIRQTVDTLTEAK